MQEVDSIIITTPLCPLKICYRKDKIESFQFVESKIQNHTELPAVLEQTIQMIHNYFSGKIVSLDALPLQPAKTDFMQKVRLAMLTIPFGETRTYKEIALQIDSHPRTVGQACKRNAYPILIPCHRVVAQKHTGGFMGHESGYFYNMKQQLLDFEKGTQLT